MSSVTTYQKCQEGINQEICDNATLAWYMQCKDIGNFDEDPASTVQEKTKEKSQSHRKGRSKEKDNAKSVEKFNW